MSVQFKQIRIGELFEANGNLCQKVSNRTARLIAYDRVFYFEQNQPCRI